MIITDSPFHITFSSQHETPSQACVGKCKKVWWAIDLANRVAGICPQCGGSLQEAVEGVHFKILKQSKRGLKAKDLRPYTTDEAELSRIIDLINKGAHIGHLSMVKPAFEAKAKR